jgi:outer membrane protein assembly factor BamB
MHGGLSLVLLLGSVNAACTTYRPPPVTEPAAAASAAAPVQVWGARAGRRLTGRITLDEGTIYAAGVDRKVYAVDLESGVIRWSSRLSGIVGGGVLVSGDTVYAASSRPQGRVYALDRTQGRQLCRTGTGPVSAPIALIGAVLLVPTQRGELVALDPRDGSRRWRRRIGATRIAPIPWGEGELIVATTDSIFRLSASDGAVRHRIRSPGTILSPWVAWEDGLVAGTTDSLVVAFDGETLEPRWRVQLDAPVLDSPAASGDTIYVATRRGTLYRIVADSAARAERIVELGWPVTAPVTIVDREILLGGADGVLRALRPGGAELWRLQLWRPIELGPLPLPDGLLVVGGQGDLHRYRR